MKKKNLIFHKGFTLIEISIILIVMGIILFVATGAWNMLVKGREISATRNMLKSTNNCLLSYATAAKRVPLNIYYKNQCQKKDTWGRSILFHSRSYGEKINCLSPILRSITIKDSDGNIHQNISWILVSSGPNKKLDVRIHSQFLDFSKGDDLFIFVTDPELHGNVCH